MQGVGQSYYTCTLIIYCTHYFIWLNRSMIQYYVLLQISDFGMSRNLENDSYYLSKGGMIPVKWTAPEV